MLFSIRRLTIVPLVSLAFGYAMVAEAAPEAFEIGPHNTDQLPRGKEADGIIGDFVLRNDKVEAVISHNALYRRANMSTFYGDTGITPGCLYDLTLRGANNDQITIFSPSGQQGMVSYVRVVKEGKEGEAVVETVVSSASNNGLYKRHEYRLRDGWSGVLIVTTLRNEGKEPRKGTIDDRWTNFQSLNGKTKDSTWGDAVDPSDKAGYAYGWVEEEGMKSPPRELDLKPGQELKFARFLAVGNSPASAYGVLSARRGMTSEVKGELKDPAGRAVGTARVEFSIGDSKVPAYPDNNGRFTLQLSPGEYAYEVSDHGREKVTGKLTVNSGTAAGIQHTLGALSSVTFDITGDDGKGLPCKAQFHGVNGTKNPDLGPQNRAHGCKDQYHSEKGQFQVQLDPGEYRIVVTRGTEFSHLSKTIKLEAGKMVTIKGALKRVVDTKGWISADFHNHSTPSGDNTCGTDDRIINLAAEHIEFAPTTEHNRLYDWRPHIYKLGLSAEINTVSGMECTGSAAHFNTFPFTPEPFTQDNGAPRWNKDPRITAVTLRDFQDSNPHRWIQINHPDMVENFIDRNADGQVDGGYLGLAQLIDGVETQNYSSSQILGGAPITIGRDRAGKETVSYIREFIWLQLLNRGHRYWGVAVCDAHSVYNNGVGGWRMYFPSKSDLPAEIDWQEISHHAKAGRSILSSGPFMEVETDDGILPGGTARATGEVNLKVKVQCTDWIDIDRVQVLVNGRQRSDVNFTRKSHPGMFGNGVVKFDQVIKVPLAEDAHIIVVAMGENSDLSIGFGTSSQARVKPCAYNNPIFVDVDGGGFTPNGDLLDWPLPAKRITIDQAKAMLKR